MTTTVWVTTRFAALHHWPEAPIEVSFLKHPHRHEFHVKFEVSVFHNERDIEFLTLKKWLDTELTVWQHGVYDYSCEEFAEQLIGKYLDTFPPKPDKRRTITVTVSEDRENGATVRDDRV